MDRLWVYNAEFFFVDSTHLVAPYIQKRRLKAKKVVLRNTLVFTSEYRYYAGSVGAILLLGKRENITWPWRQSLQGEFPHCVFLFFLCFVFLFCLCFVILYLSRSLQLFAMPWLHSPPRWTVLCVRCHLKTFNPEQEYWKLQLIKVTQIFWYFCTSRWNWITLTLEHT